MPTETYTLGDGSWVEVAYDDAGDVISATRGRGDELLGVLGINTKNKKAVVMGWLANAN